MLYFSKTKLFIIYSIIAILFCFSLLNFSSNKNNFLLSKKINLGLDLQGGSYLLLEVYSSPLINQKLQQKVINIRKYAKENKIKFKKFKIINQTIEFTIADSDIEKFKSHFLNKDNLINLYYDQFRSYEMDIIIDENKVSIY